MRWRIFTTPCKKPDKENCGLHCRSSLCAYICDRIGRKRAGGPRSGPGFRGFRGGKGFLRLTAPAALRVLRFDGPMGPRVVVGGCAANINKTFTTGLRPWENRQTALTGDGKALPLWWLRHHLPPASGGTTTRAYFRATYEWNVIRSFIVPPHSGVAREHDS